MPLRRRDQAGEGNRAAEGDGSASRSSRWLSKYEDTCRTAVLRVIDRKRKGKDVHVEPQPEREEPADLLEALRASVEAHRGKGRTGKRRNGSLAGLTKSELDERARRAGIAGRSRMTKKELVEALVSA